MITMQRVQPEIKKIQQKYKDDRTKQNEELLKFYQENKINPLAGCLPLLVILPIGIAVLGTFRRGGLPAHVPRTGTFDKLYVQLCGGFGTKAMVGPDAPHYCNTQLSKASAAGHPPAVLKFLGLNLDLSAAQAMKNGLISASPYFVLLVIVVLTGWYQVRQTQARQLRHGGAPPNSQMQTITRIMPIFFGAISFGFNSATTLYFAVSNAWRIGQQHFVLGKMYEEELQKKEGLASNGKAKAKPADDVVPPADATPSNGTPNRDGPSANAARRKKKKRKR
jgi:YidC/Oxa1 family membrane protein insertase